ncbi:MAG: RDD family protein [Micrococcales bacterium]|nr:RDD family protein [Micrococcales bacterium]
MSSATVGVGSDDLVTGEAVALDLPSAGIGLRILSGMLDITIGYVLYALGVWAVSLLFGRTDGALIAAAFTALTVLVFVGYPTAFETLTRGKTVGHYATGLRTVRDDAGPITVRHAFTRAMLGVVEIYLFVGMPALASAAFSRKGKRLGDYLAGTYVVRERQTVTLPPPAQMPPPLAYWARTADIAPLPDALAANLRQFVARAPSFAPHVREVTGRQLLAETLTHVSPAPPAGIHPEWVLAAVLAERRTRDAARLERDRQLRERLVPPDQLGSSAS